MKKSHLFILAFLPLVFTSCQPKENKIKVALAMPLTGDIAALGQGLKRSAELAFAEANAKNNSPAPFEMVSFDDRSDPKEAVSVANRIISNSDFVAVIGHFNSGCSIPASRIYAQAGLPMISPASSNPELTNQQLSSQWVYPKLIFRVNTTDNVQGAWGAEFAMKNLAVKSAAVIHDKTAYGQGVAEEFQKRFKELGGKVTAFDGLQTGDRDFRALLTRIKGTQPGLIYFGGVYSEGGILLRQARDLGFKGYFLGSEANYDQAFIDTAGPAAEGAFITFLGCLPQWMPSAKEFLQKFKEHYPGVANKSYDHYGYEAAGIVVEAVKNVGPDRKKIIDYLRGIKYAGVLGTTQFDEKGDTLNKTITIFRITDGKFAPYSPPQK
jgi:branched-chain amino acid transport system substrate-binding protein